MEEIFNRRFESIFETRARDRQVFVLDLVEAGISLSFRIQLFHFSNNICRANFTFARRDRFIERYVSDGGGRGGQKRSCMYKRRDANNRAQITRNHRARGHQPSEAAKPRWILGSFVPRDGQSRRFLHLRCNGGGAAFIASIPAISLLLHKSTVDYFRPSTRSPCFPPLFLRSVKPLTEIVRACCAHVSSCFLTLRSTESGRVCVRGNRE